jgi:hypothetical protein
MDSTCVMAGPSQGDGLIGGTRDGALNQEGGLIEGSQGHGLSQGDGLIGRMDSR